MAALGLIVLIGEMGCERCPLTMLTQLLCPVDFLESFDEDPERCGISHVHLHADNFYRFCNKLVNGSIKVHSMDFLLCSMTKH